MMMLMLLTILKMLLVMTVRAEMMMIKTGESAALECEGAWKYCEWKHHEKVSTALLPINWLNPGVTLSLLCSWLLSFTHVKQKSKMYWNEIGPVCLKS